MAFHGAFRHPQRFSNFALAQADKETKFHHVGLGCIVSGQRIEVFVHGQQAFVIAWRGDFGFGDIDAFHFASMTNSLTTTSPIDEDPPHGLCRGREEVGPILPGRL